MAVTERRERIMANKEMNVMTIPEIAEKLKTTQLFSRKFDLIYLNSILFRVKRKSRRHAESRQEKEKGGDACRIGRYHEWRRESPRLRQDDWGDEGVDGSDAAGDRPAAGQTRGVYWPREGRQGWTTAESLQHLTLIFIRLWVMLSFGRWEGVKVINYLAK